MQTVHHTRRARTLQELSSRGTPKELKIFVETAAFGRSAARAAVFPLHGIFNLND
jgi:hypothetical protein